MQVNLYAGRVRKLKSADDIHVVLDVGFGGLEYSTRVLLKDIQAPSTPRGEEGAIELRDKVQGLLQSSESVIVEVTREHKIGIVVGRIYYKAQGQSDGAYTCLNDELIDQGYKYIP